MSHSPPGIAEFALFGFTRKVDYALIALTALALEDQATGAALSARQIADHYQLPGAMLMNVLKQMNKAKLVTATRGSRGGYRLSRKPGQMLLIDILEIIEGPIRVAPCCHDIEHAAPKTDSSCGVMPRCPIMQPMKRLHERMMTMLADTTLADLISPPQAAVNQATGSARLPVIASHQRPH